MTDQENLEVQRNLFDIYSGILFNNQAFAFGGGYDMGVHFIPAGYDVRRDTLANIAYRMRKFPEGKTYFEKWMEETKAKPAPVPSDISLLTNPPQ